MKKKAPYNVGGGVKGFLQLAGALVEEKLTKAQNIKPR